MPDVVLDPFNGSGTAVTVAAKLGRRYIGIDSNADSMEVTTARLEAVHKGVSQVVEAGGTAPVSYLPNVCPLCGAWGVVDDGIVGYHDMRGATPYKGRPPTCIASTHSWSMVVQSIEGGGNATSK